MCVGDTSGRGRVKEIKVRVYGGWTSFIYFYEIEQRNLAIALSGAGKELRGRDSKGDLTNVQYKPIWNCHSEFSLYYEYILT
jgi:hypothetical protein